MLWEVIAEGVVDFNTLNFLDEEGNLTKEGREAISAFCKSDYRIAVAETPLNFCASKWRWLADEVSNEYGISFLTAKMNQKRLFQQIKSKDQKILSLRKYKRLVLLHH